MAIEHKINGFVGSPDQFMAAAMDVYTVAVTGYDFSVLDAELKQDNVVVREFNIGLQAAIDALGTRCMPVVLGAVGAGGFRFIADKADVFLDKEGVNDYSDIEATIKEAIEGAVAHALKTKAQGGSGIAKTGTVQPTATVTFDKVALADL